MSRNVNRTGGRVLTAGTWSCTWEGAVKASAEFQQELIDTFGSAPKMFIRRVDRYRGGHYWEAARIAKAKS